MNCVNKLATLQPMRRATGILIGILLGALASGLGVGYFFYKANTDRAALSEKLTETARNAQQAREQNQHVIEEANKKLLAANVEVAKAQNAIKSLEEERSLLTEAVPISSPSRKTSSWSTVVTIPFRLSFKIPSGNTVLTNDDQALIVTSQNQMDGSDARWLSLTQYNPALEQELLASLTTSTAVSYLVDGRLLTGYTGTMLSQKETILLLRIYRNGHVSNLLWAKNTDSKNNVLLDIISTMQFAD